MIPRMWCKYVTKEIETLIGNFRTKKDNAGEKKYNHCSLLILKNYYINISSTYKFYNNISLLYSISTYHISISTYNIVMTYISLLYSISIYHISISSYNYCIDVLINLMILINTSSHFILTYHFFIGIPCIYQHVYY